MEERRTKIVATIGPSSNDEATLRKMVQAGMNVARLNFSHGTHEDHEKTFIKLRALSHQLGKPLAIMQDLQGVKIRVGELAAPILLKTDGLITLTTNESPGEGKIPVDFSDLPKFLQPDSTILLDDGNMELKVKEVQGQDIICRVVMRWE